MKKEIEMDCSKCHKTIIRRSWNQKYCLDCVVLAKHEEHIKRKLKDGIQVNCIEQQFFSLKEMYEKAGCKYVISYDYFIKLISGNCFFCGEHKAEMSVIRTDKTKDISDNNCIPICDVCDKMKGRLEPTEFVRHCCKIFIKFFSKTESQKLD